MTATIDLATLVDKRIWICPKPLTKTDLLARLVYGACKEEKGVNAPDVLAQVLERERGLSTTLDTGLSIPHARVEGLEQIVAALAILPRETTDSTGKKMKIMFLFLSPARSEFFQQHLQVLSSLAQTFTPEFIQKLTLCRRPEEVQQLLKMSYQ